MSKNYNRYGEESKKTDKYGMTDEKMRMPKHRKKRKIVMALTAMTRAAPTVTAIKQTVKNSLSRNLPPGQTGT